MYLTPIGGELIAEKVGDEWHVRSKYDPVQSRNNPDGRGSHDPTEQVEG